jgi:hypothetical protein
MTIRHRELLGMTNQSDRKLASWCLSNQSLLGRIITHPLGCMRVTEVTDQGLRVEGHPFTISRDFFLENFGSLCLPKDIADLRALWSEELRQEAEKAERARLAQQRTLEEQRRRRLSIKDFVDLCLKGSRDPLPTLVCITPPVPTDEDWRLIGRWLGKKSIPEESSENRRMLSARLAEKAVLSFFQAQGCTVRDVSITQLSELTSQREWRDYDLDIDGVPLDVKNATRSRRNPDRYVRHCVARFKELRTLEAIQVAGVLSRWLRVESMRSQAEPVLFLGLTSTQEIEQIRREIDNGPLGLTFRDGLRGPSFLPPWIFNYPDSLYQARTAAISELRTLDFPDWRVCSEAKLNTVPAFIAAGRYYRYQPEISLSDSQRSLVTLLITRQNRIGLSLAVVFLSVLEHFVEMLLRESEDNYDAQDYARLIFPTTDRTRPLFLYDPLMTIDTLLTNLSTLWGTRTSHLQGFRIFRLQDLNILLGKRTPNDSQWQTLLAYCGGWLNYPVPQPCGKIPLVLGRDESCVCGKLICPDCNFCSTSCRAADKRKLERHGCFQHKD